MDKGKTARARLLADALEARKQVGRAAFGTLRILPSGRLQARYVGPDEKRYTAPRTFDTLQDADAWLALTQHSITFGTWVSPAAEAAERLANEARGVTLNGLFTDYMDEGDLKPRTRDLYTSQWDRLVRPDLGEMAVTSITPTIMATWRNDLSPAPRQREQVGDLVRAVLNLAIERQLIVTNPAAQSRRKKRGQQSRKRDPQRTFRLTPEQVEALAEGMPEHRRFAVLFAAGTGIRFGEMAALRRSDLDIETNSDGAITRVRVRIERAVSRARGEDGRLASLEGMPKTDAGVRTVGLPAKYHDALEMHLNKHAQSKIRRDGQDVGLIFPGARGGFLTSRELYGEKPAVRKDGTGRKGRGWFRARVEAGVPTARWHLLRHTPISEAVDNGARPATLLARFGHTDMTTSAIYQHSAAKDDDELTDRL